MASFKFGDFLNDELDEKTVDDFDIEYSWSDAQDLDEESADIKPISPLPPLQPLQPLPPLQDQVPESSSDHNDLPAYA